MKKTLSVILAIALAFSLCTTAFAVELPDLGALGEGMNLEDISAIFETVTSQIDVEALQDTLEDTLATFGAADITALDTSAIPGFMDMVLDQLAGLGLDVEGLKAQLSDNEILNFFASIYMGGTTPETTTEEETTEEETTEEEIPPTGTAVGGIAIFATLSLAAAAAFVCTKKKA